jgi:predicted Zn-dependent peptidase
MADKDFSQQLSHLHTWDFNSYLNMNLREEHGWTYGANTNIGQENMFRN